jgi:hypothetical protein
MDADSERGAEAWFSIAGPWRFIGEFVSIVSSPRAGRLAGGNDLDVFAASRSENAIFVSCLC